jgi:hypothetical protein
MQAYKDKGRVSKLLEEIPLFAVMEEDLGLRGSHMLAFKMLWEEKVKGGGRAGGWGGVGGGVGDVGKLLAAFSVGAALSLGLARSLRK